MAQEPVKPINEIERKTWVSDQDLILILDAESNEARLAPKEELRWEPGGKGENWEQWVGIAEITQKRDWKKVSVVIKKSDETESEFHLFDGDDGKNPEFQFSATHLQYRIQGEWNWKDLISLSAIRWGTITNIKKTEGDGSPWTTDTYTITLSDGQTFNFFVYNGNDGKWSGDMLKANNLSDLTDKAQARENLWAEAKENKKTDIESNKGSNAFFPTIKAVYDWVINKLNWKADLVNGKVPSSQLPEVSQIDESNLVHKSWDEVIMWNKTFKDAPSLATDIGWDTNIVLRKFHDVRWSKIRILFKRWSWTSENPRPANVWDVMGAINFEDAVEWNSYFGIEVRKWQGKGKAIISESDLHIWWKRPIDIHVNDQNRTGERQDYTPTLSGSWGGTPAKYWSQRWRYKIIWKMCFWWAKVEFQKWTLSGRPYISLPNKSKWEWESIGAESLVWWTGTTLKNTYWYASINDGKIEILHWFGQAGDWSAIQSWDTAISVKFFYEIE